MQTAFHGGEFWRAIGDEFRDLGRRERVINADVLDAWFPPSPGVIEALEDGIGWWARTSPPTHSEGLVQRLAEILLVEPESVLVGAGSSALIYLALGQWLDERSRVLVVEPSYGEYAHYCQHVVGCRCEPFLLDARSGFRFDSQRWLKTVCDGRFDLEVLVNPNNPTGGSIDADELERVLSEVPGRTRVLVDQAYRAYTGGRSLAPFATTKPNVFVLESLSKCFALSGLRAAYMVGASGEAGRLRRLTPPWAVSLPAQIAVMRALEDGAYYRSRYQETAVLRDLLGRGLERLGFVEQHGTANWLLAKTPHAKSSEWVDHASQSGLFLRDAGLTAPTLGDEWIRLAVRDEAMTRRILKILKQASLSIMDTAPPIPPSCKIARGNHALQTASEATCELQAKRSGAQRP